MMEAFLFLSLLSASASSLNGSKTVSSSVPTSAVLSFFATDMVKEF
jgi:hypothetical protein